MSCLAAPNGKHSHPERVSTALYDSASRSRRCSGCRCGNDGVCGEPAEPARARRADTGLHDTSPQAETPKCSAPLSGPIRAVALAVGHRAGKPRRFERTGEGGIEFSDAGEWQVRRPGASCRRQWCKIHISIDAESLEIHAVEMTNSRIGDASVLPDLLAQTPLNERIGSVPTDSIADPKGCHTAIAARGADAILPPRRNASE